MFVDLFAPTFYRRFPNLDSPEFSISNWNLYSMILFFIILMDEQSNIDATTIELFPKNILKNRDSNDENHQITINQLKSIDENSMNVSNVLYSFSFI